MKKINDFEKKASNATKWSIISEISIKLVTPIMNIILARLLTPDDFGIVSIATIIISFTEIFTDAGFQKYIIQKDFENNELENKYLSTAFWSNIILSIFAYFIIFILSKPMAVLLGDKSAYIVIKVSSIQLIIKSIASIQVGIMKKRFDFKGIFYSRLITTLIPLLCTVPLAIITKSYWAIILGNLSSNLVTTIMICKLSKWNPKFICEIKIFKKMISFTVWSMAESFTIWLTAWVDSLIIGLFLNTYTLGLYRNSISVVSSITGLIITPFVSVLFVTLSRLKDDDERFNSYFLKVQKQLATILIPASVGLLIFGELVASITLGNQWNGAGKIISLWGFMSCLLGIMNLSGEVYRSKGKPKLSVQAQVLHLVVLIPVCIFGGIQGFSILVIVRSLVRIQGAAVELYYLNKLTGLKFKDIIINIKTNIIATIIMIIGIIFLKRILYDNLLCDFISIISSTIIYFGTLIIIDSNFRQNIFVKWDKNFKAINN
ncbi:MAG: lipopolysaccharide biosynthesis protein [Paraclostridium sordellii]